MLSLKEKPLSSKGNFRTPISLQTRAFTLFSNLHDESKVLKMLALIPQPYHNTDYALTLAPGFPIGPVGPCSPRSP